MKKTLELRQSIEINGKKITKLEYDTEAITSELFCAAFSYAASKNESGRAKMAVAEMDASLHLYLGFAAIIACDSSIDMSDLERIKGIDIMTIAGIGRNFTCQTVEEDSDPSNSEQPAEATQESITPASKN